MLSRLKSAAVLLGLFAAVPLFAAEDHTEYIEGPFDTPQEVTETCLMCHDGVGEDILKTRHWNWQGHEFEMEGHGTVRLGKQNLINNFCIAVPSNYPRCTSCHIGYGWKDESFDFTDVNNIDCLVCHESTGTYRKVPTGAGMPAEKIDLVTIARSVGSVPTRRNCGTCHFDGGGGTGVKHGDMDDDLYQPTADLDVHMGMLDFNCIDCHTTENHQISGASHASWAMGEGHISCADCHGSEQIHAKQVIDKHLSTVACESCHIPLYARGRPTKTWWDWSKAGEDRPEEEDQYGKETYVKKKGEFRWGKDLVPTYTWSNGTASVYMQGDRINPEEVVKLNEIHGAKVDPESRIYPFKVMRGKQPYDPANKTLIVPQLFGPGGFWKTFDWVKAAQSGMAAVGLDFSGEVDFVETEMFWPLNHTVAPADDALRCMRCHGKKGRMPWKELGYDGDPMRAKYSRWDDIENE
ncbi:tetrathionate reductase family octaheme c-type cytochrome [bacterium]|nr:tetrathionate reductase family octaheme c-type cytochrome [bacterium]